MFVGGGNNRPRQLQGPRNGRPQYGHQRRPLGDAACCCGGHYLIAQADEHPTHLLDRVLELPDMALLCNLCGFAPLTEGVLGPTVLLAAALSSKAVSVMLGWEIGTTYHVDHAVVPSCMSHLGFDLSF
jgi:hypothetical protein